MVSLLKGIDVELLLKKQNGKDEFNQPTYDESWVVVRNVLITPVDSEDVINTLNLTGKTAVYTLCIPKGDNHTWENTCVKFDGKLWRTIGIAVGGIESMTPLDWNKKIKVERYE